MRVKGNKQPKRKLVKEEEWMAKPLKKVAVMEGKMNVVKAQIRLLPGAQKKSWTRI